MGKASEVQRPLRARAWIIPLAAATIAGMVATPLHDAGLAASQVVSACFFVGAIGGALWQALNRRDFVDRFLGWSTLAVVVMLLAALPGVGVGADESASALPGVVVGVILAEGWMRQKARP